MQNNNEEFAKPTLARCNKYLQSSEKPLESSVFSKASFIVYPVASIILLHFALTYAVNPIGSNQRILMQQRLSPAVRYLRRSAPLAVIMGSLIMFDMKANIW